jgi:hypothetical protein
MFNITVQENYIYIDDDGGTLLDKPSKWVSIDKINLNSDVYNVNIRDKCVSGFAAINWAEFTLDGVAFASQSAFEEWKNENTGTIGGGGTVAAGAVVVSFVFRGNNGTLNGMLAPDGYSKEFFYPTGAQLPQIDYTVPTTGGGGAASRGVYINISL